MQQAGMVRPGSVNNRRTRERAPARTE